MSNGDIVSGASDGVVRVFSESDTRWADAEDMKVNHLQSRQWTKIPHFETIALEI